MDKNTIKEKNMEHEQVEKIVGKRVVLRLSDNSVDGSYNS